MLNSVVPYGTVNKSSNITIFVTFGRSDDDNHDDDKDYDIDDDDVYDDDLSR